MKKSLLRSALALGAVLIGTMGFGSMAFAGPSGVICSGPFCVGINSSGSLYTPSTGFRRLSDGYDPLIPGTPRDSWGVSSGSGANHADDYDFGSNVASVNSFTSSTATVDSVAAAAGVSVHILYSFIQDNILAAYTTVTNNGAASDVKFGRDVDWDVTPTEFNENSFAGAITGNVSDSSYYGFENPNPNVAYGSSCNAGCNQRGDLGAGIVLDLGVLGTGESASFTYLYGISNSGEDVNGLIGEVNADGAFYNVATQSSEHGDYPGLGSHSTILAVATPEPASLSLLLLGLGLSSSALIRRKSGRS